MKIALLATKAALLGVVGVHVTLSRRNLKTLLLKLDEPSSAKTLLFYEPAVGVTLTVRAEEDEAHYANRLPPGPMHPREEAALLGEADLSLL